MDLKKTKEHILRVSNGHPTVMQQAALQRLDIKIQEEYIKNWAVNNKEDLIRYIEFMNKEGSLSVIRDRINLVKKFAEVLDAKRIKKDLKQFEFVNLIKKIRRL